MIDIKQLFLGKSDADAPSFESDFEAAYANIAQDFPEETDAQRVAHGMALIANHDRLNRYRHDTINRGLFLAVNRLSIFAPSNDLPDVRLVRLHNHLQKNLDHDRVHRALAQKGVSTTLAHVDQLGSWNEGGQLDDKFRVLPQSKRLRKAGFTFADTFGDKSQAKITHQIKMVNRPEGSTLMAVRKRAAADISTHAGIEYDIVKRSSFHVDVAQLGKAATRAIRRAHHRDDEAAMQALGEEIVEPLVVNPELRQENTVIRPVGSTYFVLNRFND